MSQKNTGNLGPRQLCETCSTTGTFKTLRKRLATACGVLAVVMPALAVAQTHFCIGGDTDDLTPAKTAVCQEKMAAVRTAVMQHGAPADWHFVVVCDEEGWKEYASLSGGNAARLEAAGYSTDTHLRWTFLRASEMDLDRPATTAALLDTALEGLPRQKAVPRLAPADRSRRLSIAMAGQDNSPQLPQ